MTEHGLLTFKSASASKAACGGSFTVTSREEEVPPGLNDAQLESNCVPTRGRWGEDSVIGDPGFARLVLDGSSGYISQDHAEVLASSASLI